MKEALVRVLYYLYLVIPEHQSFTKYIKNDLEAREVAFELAKIGICTNAAAKAQALEWLKNGRYKD